MSGTDDAVLLQADACATAASVSKATWHALVKQGLAPAADVRASPKFVRWRAGTIRAWLNGLAAKPAQ